MLNRFLMVAFAIFIASTAGFRNAHNIMNSLHPLAGKKPIQQRAIAYDNEEHRVQQERRLAASSGSNENMWVAQVWGGDSCNGPLVGAQVIQLDVCYTTAYDFEDPKVPGRAVPDGKPVPNAAKFSYILGETGTPVEAIYYGYYSNQAANVSENEYFCSESAMNEWKMMMETKHKADIDKGAAFVVDGSSIFNNTADIFSGLDVQDQLFNGTTFTYSDGSVTIPKVSSCEVMTPQKSVTNVVSGTSYGSMKVSKLSDLTKWMPSAETPGLSPSIGGSYSYLNVISVSNGTFLSSTHYPYTEKQCISSASNLYEDGVRTFEGGSGLAGDYKFPVANTDLYPGQDMWVHSYKLVSTADGGFQVTFFTDSECMESVWTATVAGVMRPYYVQGSGQAANLYFEGSTRYDNESIVSEIGYFSSGNGNAPLYTTKTSAGPYKWVNAYFYVGDNCDGPKYGVNSFNGGPTTLCMPDFDSAADSYSPAPIVLSSFMIVPFDAKNPQYGYSKVYYKDLECTEGKEYDTANPLIKSGAATSPMFPFANNGSCFSLSDLGDYAPVDSFQTKSWRYEGTDSAPQGMGHTTTYYTELGCGGVTTGGYSFSLTLGTNFSAPSNALNAKPSTKPYTAKTTCDASSGVMTTTWTAKNAMDVLFDSFKSEVQPKVCHTTGSYTAPYVSMSSICDGYTPAGATPSSAPTSSPTSSPTPSPTPAGTLTSSSSSSSGGLSGGAIAGIVIAVIVFMAVVLGVGYYLSLNKKAEKRASMRASQAEMTAPTASVGNPLRNTTDAPKDVVPAPTVNDV